MRISVRLSRFVIVAISTLCVCMLVGTVPAGAVGSARPPFVRGLAASQATASSVIVLSNLDGKVVDIFTPGGAPIASINNPRPLGVALDRSGNVYIASSDSAYVYKNDYKTLLLTLSDSRKHPWSIAVDKSTGVVALTATASNLADAGAVFFYRPGSGTQCKSLALPAGQFWGTFDKAGRYYVSGTIFGSSTHFVGVVTGACAATSIQPLTTANTLESPKAIRISPSGTIAIFDLAGGHPVVYSYDPPVNGTLGAPIATTALENASSGYGLSGFAFTPDGASFWFADLLHEAQKFPYPAGGLPVQYINANAFDIAIGP